MLEGIRSAASASASSGGCLNLTVSNEPAAAGAPPLAGLELPAAVGGSFFGAGAEAGAAAVGAFFVYNTR